MLILRPLAVASSSVALCAVTFAASAQIRPPLRPLLLPPVSSSASSTSSVPLASSAPSSASSASSVKTIKPMHKIAQDKHLKNYCKDIAKLLKKSQSVTPSANQEAQFHMSVDLLTKADALCMSMLAE